MKAINGKDALEQIDKTYPHIVISDVMMPEMNGLELCRRIKEDQNFCHIPVILLTAKSMVSQIEEGLEAGADDYIVKPFSLREMVARIKAMLRRFPGKQRCDGAQRRDSREIMFAPTGLCVDTTTQHVTENGEPVALTKQSMPYLYSSCATKAASSHATKSARRCGKTMPP